MLALIDGTFITAIRTGAVAALAINTLARNDYESIAIMGLGNTARATLLMLLESNPDKPFNIKLLKYKGQEITFKERFADYKNINFEFVDTYESLMRNSDVIISCVTYADNNFGKDEWFKEGCLVVPVHTMGFQNCDLFFDKAIMDDYNHVKEFKYYNKLKYCAELSEVLKGERKGRENNSERIVAYNIGISIEDICLAKLIYDKAEITNELDLKITNDKFRV